MPKPDADLEIDPDPQLEREADQAAEEALSEGPVTINRMGTDVHVQRSKHWKKQKRNNGEFGEFKEEHKIIENNREEAKPYANSRPDYAPGQEETVWEQAKDEDGNVYDPNTGEQLEWDRNKPRDGQWDMGHKPDRESS